MLNFLANLLPVIGNAPSSASPGVPSTNNEGLAPLADFAGYTLQVIDDPRQILNILRGFTEARQPISLSSQHLPQNMTTRLLGLEPRKQKLLIRQLTDERAHQAVLQDAYINLFAHLGDSPLMMSVVISEARDDTGMPCYAADLPTLLLHFQMRSTPRVLIPEARKVTLLYTSPGHVRIEARVFDISESGLGLILRDPFLHKISRLERWHEVSLISSEGEMDHLTLQLHRIIPTASGQQYIGASIADAPEAVRQQLRRLIMRCQTQSKRYA